ncbi:hypothetical protein F3Y22_tig00000002pilonHSYRG00355 [Hibiscus syriacus]|uniref:BIRD-IDD transcription factor second C2H2 zinc finger domain-containing protein n=1 Tax=Hibiscus syriacus TaxID=106335 RepID=A0A6A3D3Z1_HIBSY|nr:hypothetical protein F3Y22_tig00000002pilonHSYRG00355 [Hibiscus syriacus]
MHPRRHKVPWKLLKRETPVVRKRVFVYPEPSYLHHDPFHALGDLVWIKKHFRRKHCNYKQWGFRRIWCSIDCESMEIFVVGGWSVTHHWVFGKLTMLVVAGGGKEIKIKLTPGHLNASSPSLSYSETLFFRPTKDNNSAKNACFHNLDLQLSIGSSGISERIEPNITFTNKEVDAREQIKQAMAGKAYVEELRQQARRLIELAEQELAKAKRLRQSYESSHSLGERLVFERMTKIPTPPNAKRYCHGILNLSSPLTRDNIGHH